MLLKNSELRFLQGIIESPSDKRVSEIAEHCSDELKIGKRIGQRFSYSRADVDRSVELLRAHGLPLYSDELSDRASSVNRPSVSEKVGTQGPHQDSVAYRLFNGLTPVGVGYSVAQADEVGAISAQVMMVVENFETLRQLHRYSWVLERMRSWSTCLVIYRGESIYSTADAQRAVQASHLPKIGFHDYDPAGLFFSAQLPGLVEHLAPPMNLLETVVKSGQRTDLYFDNLAQYRLCLDKCEQANIPLLWANMKRLQRGYPQEWMRDIGK